MSASKSKVTNSLLGSEKKSLVRFLTLYVGISIIIISLLSFFYYQSQEKLMLAEQRANLAKYAYIQTKRLKVLHHFFDERTTYPRDPRFKSAIYDLEYAKIFSELENNKVVFEEGTYRNGNHIHLVKTLDNFYLGTKYLVIEVPDDGAWKRDALKNIMGYGIFAFFLSLFFGLLLAKRFVKPMRDSMVLLDRFIKDTTHELNTPLSAILANIEMMDTDVMVEKNRSRLNRINIAAKTVSVLYKDLTYLTLEQERENRDEYVALKRLIEDRADYFAILAQSKNLKCALDLDETTLFIDKRKITRVIDNLISNAIKYNRRNGTIGIVLKEDKLVVWDTGIGIKDDDIPFVFDRYLRFDDSEGGFGVGLSIVKTILDEYGIKIDVESAEGKGTKMVITW